MSYFLPPLFQSLGCPELMKLYLSRSLSYLSLRGSLISLALYLFILCLTLTLSLYLPLGLTQHNSREHCNHQSKRLCVAPFSQLYFM